MQNRELLSKIKTLRAVAWEGHADDHAVKAWLDNFDNDDEKLHALHLLSRFVYFSSVQVRQLLKSLYRDKFKIAIVNEIRKSLGDSTDLDQIQGIYNQKLNRTRFMGVGNPAESGCHLLYYFRQENNLSKQHFLNTHEIFSRDQSAGTQVLKVPEIERYVFVDDFCGSGQQGVSYSKDLVEDIRSQNPDAEVYYLVLLGQVEGLNHIRSEANFTKVEAVYELDPSFKCFNDDSRHFRNCPSDITSTESKRIAHDYGLKICPHHPLGYEGSELLLGFHHNTPDNTLPMIWSTGNDVYPWSPIFKRYPKIY